MRRFELLAASARRINSASTRTPTCLIAFYDEGLPPLRARRNVAHGQSGLLLHTRYWAKPASGTHQK
jgi:hypothetical protein